MGAPMPTHAPISWTVWLGRALGGVIIVLLLALWQQAERRGDDHESRLRTIEAALTRVEVKLDTLQGWVGDTTAAASRRAQ